MKYTLTITPDDAKVLAQALDLFVRVGLGQFDQVLRVYVDPAGDIPPGRKEAEKKLYDAKRIITGLPGDAHRGITSSQVQVKFKEAFNILQVLNHSRAVSEGDNLSIWNHDPIPVGINLELPTVKPTVDDQWTVIGFFPDDKQRWAQTFTAANARDAELYALQYVVDSGYEPINVVGVVKGDHAMADVYNYLTDSTILETDKPSGYVEGEESDDNVDNG